ncbi:MAG: bifunctional [glutamate--ammonia ligase]-adenylyl-L-tyrosine phosphorylase/[glutamate--ammonia-ligase] adenylyltransferase [Desulfosarcinaceae bacterium]|nr:bifunctional [glutamate--ammonia ligase]-adenylyl-L-tyrosine phosphorylase/[glutamate--ammonia-ligase] adenylyltransferase [Desulfosarcinaceae bacterium]
MDSDRGTLTPTLLAEGQAAWERFAATDAAAGLAPSASAPLLRAVFALSPFVAQACIRHPRMAAELVASGDLMRAYAAGEYTRRLNAHLSAAPAPAPTAGQDACLVWLQGELRRFRRREMVRIAYRDLAGLGDYHETVADLSALADASIVASVDRLHTLLAAAYGQPCGPGDPDRSASAEGTGGVHGGQSLVVLGMGKLGARELNFSSDIDLIFAYPANGNTVGGPRSLSNDAFFTRLARLVIKALGATTADGIVFRVDTRLRPFGDSGPLVMSFDAMEDYYQQQGREWERYALIKARAVAGDPAAGDEILERLKPFVYRRYLDFGAFESLREMKAKIVQEVKRRGLADNVKLGAGGIREIEFFAQMFQLLRGGVMPALQERRLLRLLDNLVAAEFISSDVCRELTAAYVFLRNTEHRLQMCRDQQTHDLPVDAHERLRLAQGMGFADWAAFADRLGRHRQAVSRHFDALLEAPEADAENARGDLPSGRLGEIWEGGCSEEEAGAALEAAGYDDPMAVCQRLDMLRETPATRQLSRKGRRRLDRLVPRILKAVGAVEAPMAVLDRILALVATIQRRTIYLSLLLEHPQALTHLVRLAAASPWIVTYLSRHPVLLDELLDARTLYQPPLRRHMAAELSRRLERIDSEDLEQQMEVLRVFKQGKLLRVAASDITSVLPLMRVSDYLSDIAEILLETVVRLCWDHLVAKHGRPVCTGSGAPQGRGFVVLAYGKLGGLELGYGSDLDLVFLHAAAAGETVGGPRPVTNTQFYARLGQRVVHMFSAHTPAGVLYEADMRLRPDGDSGLLVSHIDAFRDYQRTDAWVWEHQALIRARAIVGDRELMREFAQIRREILGVRRAEGELRQAVAEMRAKLRQAKSANNPEMFDLKQDPGGIVDIEFLVQYLVLANAHRHPDILRWTDNVRLLQSLAEVGAVGSTQAHLLRRAYLIYRAMAHRLNLRALPAQFPIGHFAEQRHFVRRVWRHYFGRRI